MFFFSQWWFFIRYWLSSTAFIPTFLFFTLGVGIGILVITKQLEILKTILSSWKNCIVVSVLSAFCIAQLFMTGCYHWGTTNRLDYWSPYSFYKKSCVQISLKGVLFNKSYFLGMGYLQQCENYRIDLTNLNMNEILHPQFFSPLTTYRYPLINIPPDRGDGESVQAIIGANLHEHNIYWDINWDSVPTIKKSLMPAGLLFAYSPPPHELTLDIKKVHLKSIKKFFLEDASTFLRYNDTEEKIFYSVLLEKIARFFYEREEYSLSFLHLSWASEFQVKNDEWSVNLLNGLASCCLNLGRLLKAKKFIKEALTIHPLNSTSLQILGRIYLEEKKYDSAYDCYKKILEKNPNDRYGHFGMGVYFTRIGKKKQAREFFQKVLALNSDDDLAQKARAKLISMGELLGKKN